MRANSNYDWMKCNSNEWFVWAKLSGETGQSQYCFSVAIVFSGKYQILLS